MPRPDQPSVPMLSLSRPTDIILILFLISTNRHPGLGRSRARGAWLQAVSPSAQCSDETVWMVIQSNGVISETGASHLNERLVVGRIKDRCGSRQLQVGNGL